MRPLTGERGAIAVLVAFSLVALMGFGAIVVDAGALYRERRELQNGADAAALAVASDCAAAGCGAFTTTADTFADANADDGDSDVAEVCGSITAGLAACADPPEGLPDVASYVRVRTTTRNAATEGDEIRFGLARVLGFDGKTVQARSTVAWGPPAASGVKSPPLIFSMCEYYEAVTDPSSLPYYPDEDPTTSPERTVYFHDPTAEGGCPAGPSGFDESGGFGWLENTGCVAEPYTVVNEDGVEETWVRTKTGTPVPNGCDPANWHDGANPTVLTLPFFDETNGESGDNLAYRIAGYASIYVTGFRFPGGKWPNTFQCPGGANESCIQGHFVRAVIEGTEFGTVDLGTVMVKVIE
jgi:Flp pilus assembly protein TadG